MRAVFMFMVAALLLPPLLALTARATALEASAHACQCPMARKGSPCACPACHEKADPLAKIHGAIRDRCADDGLALTGAIDIGVVPPDAHGLVGAYGARAFQKFPQAAPKTLDWPPPTPPPRLLRATPRFA